MSYPATFAGWPPAAAWADQNPVLAQFEMGVESDSGAVKVGDGVTAWNDLPHFTRNGMKVYRATLTQTGTDAPVATVLENTFGGELVWTRTAVGSYAATLTDAFPDANKVFIPTSSILYITSGDVLQLLTMARATPHEISVITTDITVNLDSAEWEDINAPVEIIVYP